MSKLYFNFNNIFTVSINSRRKYYLKYFRHEFSDFEVNNIDNDNFDMNIYLDFPFPKDGDRFHFMEKIFKIDFCIKGINTSNWQVYFKSNAFYYLYPLINAVNFHSMVLMPLIYYKMLLKNILLLHACAVSFGDEIFVFPANTRVGKTSTALRLIKKGFVFVSDDATLVGKTGEVTALSSGRIHIFSDTLKIDSSFKIPLQLLITLLLKDLLRNLFNILFKQKFYISTRVPVNVLVPIFKKSTKGKLKKIIVLSRNIENDCVQLSNSNLSKYLSYIQDTLENNRVLFNIILNGKTKELHLIKEKEDSLLKNILLNNDTFIVDVSKFKNDIDWLIKLILK